MNITVPDRLRVGGKLQLWAHPEDGIVLESEYIVVRFVDRDVNGWNVYELAPVPEVDA